MEKEQASQGAGGGDPSTPDEPATISLQEFLEHTPPSQERQISDLFDAELRGNSLVYFVASPALQLHCSEPSCGGVRTFRTSAHAFGMQGAKLKDGFLHYHCGNCAKGRKTFSVAVGQTPNSKSGRALKYGEHPTFGAPVPNRLLRLFGKDSEVFLKGRRCENQGLGIGAFAYYRRVVESHKNQIFDEIIRVSEKVGAPREMIAALEAGKAEIQFSKALAGVKDAIPQTLLVNGHNPLTLLHTALSAGLHEETDERCLELAHDVRIVLSELAERLSQALKDGVELNHAVSRLMQPKK